MQIDSPKNPALVDDSAEPEVTLAELIGILMRHIWAFLLVLALSVGATVYVVAQLPRVFEANSVILVERRDANLLGLQSANEDPTMAAMTQFLSREFFQVQLIRLRSTELADRVISRLGLISDDRFWIDFRDDAEFQPSREIAIDYMREILRVDADTDARTLSISLRHRSPDLAAEVVNEYAELFVSDHLDRRLQTTDSALRWLDQQFHDLSDDLVSVELQMFEFLRERSVITISNTDRANPRVQEIEALGAQLVDVRLQVDRLEAIVRQIRRATASGDVLSAGIEGLVDNPLIQQLKTRLVETRAEEMTLAARYGPSWDELQAVREQRDYLEEALQNEVNQVLESYRHQYENAREVEARLVRRLESANAEAIEMGQNEVEYGSLSRQAETYRELVSMMERRLRELELARMLEFNAMQVLERARTPERPVSPRKALLWAAGFLIGFVLAGAVALILDQLSAVIRSREELQSKFGLSVIGMIPHVDRGALKKLTSGPDGIPESQARDRYVHYLPRSVVAESCRSIRTNLLFMKGGEKLTSFAVVSASPREGKTMTSTCMATVFAQSGMKVVLIDADMRKPRLHKVFDIANTQGLSDLLVGSATLDQVTRTTEIDNLSIISCGPIPKDSTGLLHSPRFLTVLEEIKANFDLVIFDTPPLAPVTDASLIATHLDGALMVVKIDSTRREILAHAVEQLNATRSRLLGIVVNNVDLHKRGSGYYGSYYRQYGAYIDEANVAGPHS